MTTNIYIIKLNQNKYYIGHAINLEQRLNDHAEGKISKYTQKYKPLNIKKIIPDANPKYLDKYVIKYMEKYGMNSVRGGSFENEILSKEQIKYLISQGIKKPSEDVRVPLSLAEQQNLEQRQYKEDIMQQPNQLMQRRRPESSLKQDVLRIPIRQANGTCWICGLDGHYKENCNRNNEISGFDQKEEIDELDYYFKSNLRG